MWLLWIFFVWLWTRPTLQKPFCNRCERKEWIRSKRTTYLRLCEMPCQQEWLACTLLLALHCMCLTDQNLLHVQELYLRFHTPIMIYLQPNPKTQVSETRHRSNFITSIDPTCCSMPVAARAKLRSSIDWVRFPAPRCDVAFQAAVEGHYVTMGL